MIALIVPALLSPAFLSKTAAASASAHNRSDPAPKLVSQGLEGYISMAVDAPPPGYGCGVSLYANAWPLTKRPLRDFQIGLASIWIVPDNRDVNTPLLPHGTLARDNWPERGPSYRDVFQTIEGGLGFWGDTRYGSPTAKFRMNGTCNGYNDLVSTPGWGFGGGPNTSALAEKEMAIVQLSNRILVPPDGFTFKKGTNNRLLGYAWMALPLTDPQAATAGLPVPTGNQCWTLFLNTADAKGPVAFWTPTTWSRISLHYPPAVGRGLDTLPGLVTGGAIEVNTVPRFTATAPDGTEYSKVPQLQFPVDADGRTLLIEDLTHYSAKALWNEVLKWKQGGSAPDSRFNPDGASTPTCRANPLILRQGASKTAISEFDSSVNTAAWNGSTFGLTWKKSALSDWGSIRKGTFPTYFKKVGDGWQAIPESEVPGVTGLKSAAFPPSDDTAVYTSPSPKPGSTDGAKTPPTCWSSPGPAAGPFYAHLSDGSVVTYWWYRFIDQPSMQNTGLSAKAKAKLQKLVESIQRHWTLKKQYMSPPSSGQLAVLDPAMIVRPPKGLEYGYVPIATEQRMASK